jgi:uncharacterized ferritin-like protein (DUF455 family)
MMGMSVRRNPDQPKFAEQECVVNRLCHQVDRLTQSSAMLASWTLTLPDLLGKVLFAHHLYMDVRNVQVLLTRLEELGAHTAKVLDEVIEQVPCPKDLAQALQYLYFRFKQDGLDQVQTDLAATKSVWDDPTRWALERLGTDLRAQREEASLLASRLGLAVGPGHADSLPERGPAVPALPARSDRFVIVDKRPVLPSLASAEDRMAQTLAHFLMRVEVPSIEMSARNVLDNEGLPWDFVLDMARQCWDEGRHCQAVLDAIASCGDVLERNPIDHTLWRMTRNQPLKMRLMVTQRIGEWVGVDALLDLADKYESEGARGVSEMLRFMALDETGHVRQGNKWLRTLAGDEELLQLQQEADALRGQFGEPTTAKRLFPFHRWACELSGFTDEETRHLAAST